MVLIFHAALESDLKMHFKNSHPWNAPRPAFSQLLNMGKMQLRIFYNQLLELNQGMVTVLQ